MWYGGKRRTAMRCSGARILIESLIDEGVDTVFGIPGGYVLHIYDELYACRKRIRHILVSHEQHAAHAADGYARSSGKTGVCIATSGPGATNLVTGIAAAYMDSVPLVAITGNVPLHLLGKDSFQETDITGITMPVVKHNWIVKDVRELAEVVREAFIVARQGRPGPVLIDIPADISAAKAEWKPAFAAAWEDGKVLGARARRLSGRSGRVTFTEADIAGAAALLCGAERPMIYAGGGVNSSGAEEELAALAGLLNAPVALSLMGIGAMRQDHPLCTGLIGMHGTAVSNRAVQKADLLAVIGARFSDRVTSRLDRFAPHARILHIDIDPAEINKNRNADFWVLGDAKRILRALIRKIGATAEGTAGTAAAAGTGDAQSAPPPWLCELRAKVPAVKKSAAKKSSKKSAGKLEPRFIVEETARRMGRDALVITDVGQHQMWAAQYYPVDRPRSFLSSGGLGAMGFGLGAALGAMLANPGRRAVLFSGDGSFRMNSGELAALVSYRVPLLIVLVNNGALGMVRQWQQVFCGGTFSETSLPQSPDFNALAAAYGVRAFRAAGESEFRAALDGAVQELEQRRPAFVEALIDGNEMVLPMVPGGRPLDEQIF